MDHDDEPRDDDLTPEQDAIAADRARGRERMPGDDRQADVEAARSYERWLDTL